MKLVESVVKSFRVARDFKEKDAVISMDFSFNGDFLVTCNRENEITFYDCENGTHMRLIYSKKYGVDLVRYTHSNSSMLYASTKVNHDIRHLCIEENKFLRYLPGHTKRVTTLAVSPMNDSFLSAAMDKTIRLWDLRSAKCTEVLPMLSYRPVVAYDREGMVFAAALYSRVICLYDIRFVSKGPFKTVMLQNDWDCEWIGMKFSPDSQTIMLWTNTANIRLINAFNWEPIHMLSGHENIIGLPVEASFSPDSQFVFSGSLNGKIHAWIRETGRPLCVLNGKNHDLIRCVQFSPKYMMLVSVCRRVKFWLPNVTGNTDE